MSASTKINARTAFLAHLKANGWVLDRTHTFTKTDYGRNPQGIRTATETRVQEPFSYTKPAAHGGRWRIVLDYERRDSWHSTIGNTLRGITVGHITSEKVYDNGKLSVRHIGYLKPNRRYNSTNWLTEVLLAHGLLSLRKQAEYLAIHPDLIVWLALEAEHVDKVKKRADMDARIADQKAREQNLAVTVGQEGYGSDNEWWVLSKALQTAANAVVNADGKTDLPAALDALLAAVAAVDAVVIR